MKKTKINLCCFLSIIIALVTLSVINLKPINVCADEETVEQRIVRLTNTDIVNVNGGIDIKEFALRAKTGYYTDPLYPDNVRYNGIITELVPEVFFCTAGVHSYIGKEWGFILYTAADNLGWQNWLMLIDFEMSNFDTVEGGENQQFVDYRMENLVQMYFSTTPNSDGTYTIMRPSTYFGFEFYITDIVAYANLLNENEPNRGDINYNKARDTGDVITHGTLVWQGYEYDPTNEDDYDWTPLATQLLNEVVGSVTSKIPVVSTILGIYNDINDTMANIRNGFISTGTNIEIHEDYLKKTYPNRIAQKDSNNQFYREMAFVQYDNNISDSKPKQVRLYNDMEGAFGQDNNVSFDNDYVNFSIFTSEESSNSRLQMGFGFTVYFTVAGNCVIVEENDGALAMCSVDLLEGKEPYAFVHFDERKIQNEPVKNIKNVAQAEDIPNDDMADDPAYLLDKNGYAIYKFQPKLDDEYAFGEYVFSTEEITGYPNVGTRIHLFENLTSDEIGEIIRLSKEDLLNHGKLIAYNYNTTSDMWQLSHNFVNQGNDTANTYYLLYKYAVDYSGGPSFFNAHVEFLPPALQHNTVSCSVSIASNTRKYFSYVPSVTGNYVFTVNGLTELSLDLYNRNNNLIEQCNANTLSALLIAGQKYVIAIENANTVRASSVSVVVNNGVVAQLVDSQYSFSCELLGNQKKYFSFTPNNLSGTYRMIGANQTNLSGLGVNWYDSEFNLIEENNIQAFVSKGQTYYISIRNNGVSTFNGTVLLEYQNDIASFSASLQIITEDVYKKYFAYVIESSNLGDNNFLVTVAAMVNEQVIQNYTEQSVNGLFIWDLTDFRFDYDSFSFNAVVDVGGEEIVLEPIDVDNLLTTYNGTNTEVGGLYTNEYVHIKFEQAHDYVNECIVVASTVKVLSIDAPYLTYIQGVCIEVQVASQPLIINIHGITMIAPNNRSAILSNRDIILNVQIAADSGKVSGLVGGDGVQDGFFEEINGDSAIEISDNTFVINGGGNLNLTGGNGGDTSNGMDYYYTDKAGNGGTAIEVGNLVVNCNKLTARGGNGGRGGNGMVGTDGADGVGQQSSGVGNNGGNGTNGGEGCDGGHAGMGIIVFDDYCVLYTNHIWAYGGSAGRGGDGGKGGDGGDGAAGEDGGLFGGQKAGGNGGRGGNGGNGGDYGTGMAAFNYYSLNKIIYKFSDPDGSNQTTILTRFNTWSADGTPGSGGAGGTGGLGGPGGKNTWGTQAASGQNGVGGTTGSAGGDPSPSIAMANITANVNSSYPSDYFNDVYVRRVDAYLIEKFGKEKANSLFGIVVG